MQMFALRRHNTSSEKPNICYRLARSPRGLWEAVVDEEFLGTAQTKERLQKAGWRVVPVTLLVED